MGVPSFYRWLVNKYSKIVCDAVEEKGDNSTSPSPNKMEFDNFYLDMNGIIHPCFHPDDNLFSPTTYEEVFRSIFEYIDQLFNIVRPRKLLFLAIDGVAPRAKMNQQRARRFRTAKEIQMADEMEEKLRKVFEREGKAILPKEESQVADSNVITPGTEFMSTLSKQLQSYISRRMNDSPAWASIKVILSNDTVPGEGEHKIMSFIRAQRSLPGYDPNTRHCLYGLDADLIMLALATHEIHFSILREEVLAPENQRSLVNKESPWQKPSSKTISESKDVWGAKKVQPYQFLNIWILREYLALDLQVICDENFECDLERIIDDFIFICFFAGNDFLPHMPSLSIHEGCLDLLMHVYKKEFQNLGGYLVDMQKVDDKNGGFMKLKRIERFILMVGSHEDKIFSKRSQIKDKKLRRILNEYRDAKQCEKNDMDDERVSDVAVSCHVVSDAHEEIEVCASDVDIDTVLSNTKDLKQRLKDYIRDQSDLFKDGGLGTDKVKFGTHGWRERYYNEKFGAETAQDIEATRKDVVAKYGEGLCWVLRYYFSGVPSWTWFYPYHYGPLASDLKGLSQTNLKFQKGLPFKPFVQLLGVLPPMSVHALPLAYKGLMIDENSNIIDFYPTEFETDTDGKRFTWQGISKLPFIEEERLLTETKKLESELKEYEKTRNSESLDRLFLSYTSKECQLVLQNGTKTASEKIKDAIAMESPIEGIKGTIHLMPEYLNEADNNKKGAERNDLCLFYEIDRDCRLVSRLLECVNIPEKTVNEDDIVETTLWHEAGYGNRFHNQRPTKPEPEHKWEPRSQNHNPGFISKGAGRGFSLGRGKPSAGQTSSSQSAYNERSSTGFVMRNDYNRDFQGHRTSGSDPRPMSNNNNQPRWQGRGGNCVSQSAYNEGSSEGFMTRNDYNKDFQGLRMSGSNPRPMLNNNHPRWKGRGGNFVSQSAYDEGSSAGFMTRNDYNRDFQGLRISGSNPRPILNNYNEPRWQGRGGNFSPSGRGASEDWRSNRPSGADRTGSSWQQNYGSNAGPVRNMSTGRGRGRGWVAPQN